MRLLAVEGVTGREAAIGKEIVAALKEAGVPGAAIRFDDAHTRIPLPTQTGNLIVDLPGTGAHATRSRLLFMTHMDTVPLCAGAKPKRQGKRIVNTAKTALGGDNRTGCAVLVTLAAELLRHKLPHPPLTLLFTVREESGLFGARHLDPADLGGVSDGLQLRRPHRRPTSSSARSAPTAGRWRSSAGRRTPASRPSAASRATMVLALALAEVHAGGWFGKVVKDGRKGTSNVGPVGGANDGPRRRRHQRRHRLRACEAARAAATTPSSSARSPRPTRPRSPRPPRR